MQLHLHKDYSKLTDGELVGLILGQPHDDEAALALLFIRYQPLIIAHCKHFGIDVQMYLDDATASVFADLKGPKADWAPLASYRGKCRFPHWIKTVSYRSIYRYYCNVIVNKMDTISLDEEDENGNPIFLLPDFDEEEYDRCCRKIQLLESISELKNEDYKFCILKHLEGYNSTETATLLKNHWEEIGTVKTNAKGELVIPTRAYVDVLFMRAKDELRKILLMKNCNIKRADITFCGAAVPQLIDNVAIKAIKPTRQYTSKQTFLGRLDSLLDSM